MRAYPQPLPDSGRGEAKGEIRLVWLVALVVLVVLAALVVLVIQR